MKKLLLPIYILSIVSCISTEVEVNGRLEGQVRAANTNSPIENCVVSIDLLNLYTRTNSEGDYSFDELDMGNYIVTYNATNYQSLKDSVNVVIGLKTRKDVFLNAIGVPNVLTSPATNISYKSATINGNLIQNGGSDIIECGFYWGKSSSNMERITTTIEPVFSYELDNLESNCHYYYKAFSKNSFGEGVGDIVPFITNATNEVKVETKEATDITGVSATVSALITSATSSSIISLGFYIGTDKNNLDQKISVTNTGSTSFFYELTELYDYTTYYYQAFVTTSDGESFGDIFSFTTLEIVKPTVLSHNATNIAEESVTLNGTLSSLGNDPNTEYGFCYGTSVRDLSYVKSVGKGSILDYSLKVSGLQKLTTYYFRSYATNRKGTNYGDVKSFTTSDFNGHEFVDLNLPSGKKWAKYNIGSNNLYEPGSYYIWASSLNSFVDMAQNLWGGTWSMPTKDDIDELIKCCKRRSVSRTENGVTTYWSELTGDNGNVLILPAGGLIAEAGYKVNSKSGYFWTSTPGEDVSWNPYYTQRAYLLETNSTSYLLLWPIFYKANIRPISK